MIVVREVFIAKRGMASKLARWFKEQMTEGRGIQSKVMTDMTGVFNKVVIETQYDDMVTFEKEMEEFMNQTAAQHASPAPSPHVDMYIRGKREIFRVW